MEPTIGRIVLVTVREAFVRLVQYPAIVTKVNSPTNVNAVIFNGSAAIASNLRMGDGTEANTWVWPPRPE